MMTGQRPGEANALIEEACFDDIAKKTFKKLAQVYLLHDKNCYDWSIRFQNIIKREHPRVNNMQLKLIIELL